MARNRQSRKVSAFAAAGRMKARDAERRCRVSVDLDRSDFQLQVVNEAV